MSGDHLQQEFYQLAQEKNEKVRQFTGKLEQKYKYLKEKFPDRYQTKDLKDRLFHGMHPYICKSMRFLYKKPEVTYEEPLSETLEAEKDCCPPKSMTVKSKAAHNTKINSLKGNGNKDNKTKGNSPRKVKGQLHQLHDPFILAKSHYNVINVGAGARCTRNVPHRGH